MQIKKSFKSVNEYFDAQSEGDRRILEQIREIIKKTAPEAEEVISYQMPGFRYYGMLVWYAVFANHYSLFPTPATIAEFREQLRPYEVSKGTIKFPKSLPVPAELITEIVRSRIRHNLSRAKPG